MTESRDDDDSLSNEWMPGASFKVLEGLMLKDYIEMTGSIFVVLDENGIVRLVNERCLEMLEAGRDRVIGRNWFEDFIPPSEIAGVEEIFSKIMKGEGEEVRTYQNGVMTVSGTIRTIRWLNSYVKDGEGRIRFVIGSGEDVTESIKAREEEGVLKKRLEAALEGAEMGFWELDLRKRVIRVDTGNLSGIGKDIERDVMSWDEWTDMIRPEDAGDVQTLLERYLDGDSDSFDAVFRIESKSGNEVWMRMKGKIVERGGDLEPVLISGTVLDITAQKKAELNLKLSEERFRSIFERSTLGIYRSSADGRVLLANPALVKMLGYDSLEDLMKRDINKEGYGDPSERELFKRRVESEGEIRGQEMVWKRKDGSDLIVNETARCVRDPEGNVLYYEGFVEDITEKREMEESLLESRRQLEKILESVQAGIVIIDAVDNIILDANPKARDILGVKEEDIINREAIEKICPARDVYSLLMDQEEGIESGEQTIVNCRGENVTLLRTSAEIELQGRKAIVESFVDITEMKNARERLKEVEERHTSFMDSATDGFIITDAEMRILEANGPAMEWLSFDRTDMEGRNLFDIMKIKGYSLPDEALKNVVEMGVPVTVDELVSEWRPGMKQYTMKFFPVGEGLGIIITNITSIKEAEFELKRQKTYLENLFDGSPEAIAVLDPEEKVIRVNRGFERLFGFTKEEVIGRYIDDLIAADDLREEALNLTKLVKDGETVYRETRRITKYGKVFDVSLIGTPIRVGGHLEALYATYRDITQKKRAELAMIEAKEKAEEATRMKNEFISILSHDLGTPITVIKGNLELIEQMFWESLDENLRRILKNMKGSVDIMDKIRMDTLDISRMDMGSMSLEKEDLDITRLIRDTAEEMKIVAAEKNQEILVNVPQLPHVNVDPIKIKRAISNYLSNAIRYSDEGSEIRVGASLDDNVIKVWVRDTGRGLAEEKLKKVFERFYRTGKRVKGSTGLGLAIVKGIVEAHGGKVWAESEGEGKGSTFLFSLPLVG